jgi:hypothetical protein
MKLNLPKMVTFWVAVGVAAVSVILYIIHLIVQTTPYMGGIAFALLAVAFILLCLGLLVKGL